MTLSIHIMTVEERHPFLLQLIYSLGRSVDVCCDVDRKGPWFNARTCWTRGLDSGRDHILVLHDDVVLCQDFAPVVERAIEVLPGEALSFFCTREENAKAEKAGYCWTAWPNRAWGAALCLPRKLAGEFVDWCDRWTREEWLADDTRLALFLAATGRFLYCSTTSLVQHRPGLESAFNGRHNTEMMAPTFGTQRIWSRKLVLRMDGDRRSLVTSRKKWLTGDPLESDKP